MDCGNQNVELTELDEEDHDTIVIPKKDDTSSRLLYELNDVPPWYTSIFLGVQVGSVYHVSNIRYKLRILLIYIFTAMLPGSRRSHGCTIHFS